MPIIKDKYGAKGENTRSKYITRKDNKAIAISPNYESTFQKKEREANLIRSASIANPLIYNEGVVNEKIGLISGIKLGSSAGVLNTLENILILNEGESLKDIIISHYGGSEAVFSLYWSSNPPSDIKYTLGTGLVDSITRGSLYRLMTDNLVSTDTLSLNSNNMFDSFNNINKTVYFYAIASTRGVELTMLKC